MKKLDLMLIKDGGQTYQAQIRGNQDEYTYHYCFVTC